MNDESIAVSLASALLSAPNARMKKELEAAPIKTAAKIYLDCLDALREERARRDKK